MQGLPDFTPLVDRVGPSVAAWFTSHVSDRPDIDLDLVDVADLDLPVREAHDAINDAVMAALAFIKLRQLL